tara:strand:+ start:513 stop:770 length:258 start_codon:yes stop_codon:yes gene_type:complete
VEAGVVLDTIRTDLTMKRARVVRVVVHPVEVVLLVVQERRVKVTRVHLHQRVTIVVVVVVRVKLVRGVKIVRPKPMAVTVNSLIF